MLDTELLVLTLYCGDDTSPELSCEFFNELLDWTLKKILETEISEKFLTKSGTSSNFIVFAENFKNSGTGTCGSTVSGVGYSLGIVYDEFFALFWSDVTKNEIEWRNLENFSGSSEKYEKTLRNN